MKTIIYTNYILLGIYAIYCLYGLLSADSSGMDAAGKGMAKGFAIVGLGIIIVLLLINLINIDWVRIIVFAVCLIPVLMVGKQIQQYFFFKKLDAQQYTNDMRWDDPHLKAIARAVDGVDVEELERLLSENDNNINEIGYGQLTVLHLAIQYLTGYEAESKTRVVELLFEHGADPNATYRQSNSILAEVAVNLNDANFKMILDAGADPNGKDENGIPILFQLVRDHHRHEFEKVRMLLEKGADPNIPFGHEGWMPNYSALIFAASHAHWDICELLIDHGADLNFQTKDGPNFWDHYNRYRTQYSESGTLPEDFVLLSNNPKIQQGLKSVDRSQGR